MIERYLLCLAVVLSSFFSFLPITIAAEIPAWMSEGNHVSDSDAQKRLWLIVAGSVKKPLEGVHIVQKRILVRHGNQYDDVYDFAFSITQDGETIHYDRGDIAYVNYYSQTIYQISGVPVSIQYYSEIIMNDGRRLHDLRDVNSPNALYPDRFYYRKAMYGTRGIRDGEYTVEPFQDHVLAMSWNKNQAEQLKNQILLHFARAESNRFFISWKKPTKVYTPNGLIEVIADYDSKVTFPFTFSSETWHENTDGNFSLIIDGRRFSRSFTNDCLANLQRSGRSNTCSKQPRVSTWISDDIAPFTQAYVDNKGVYVFYGTGNIPEQASDVDVSGVNVGFNLEVE